MSAIVNTNESGLNYDEQEKCPRCASKRTFIYKFIPPSSAQIKTPAAYKLDTQINMHGCKECGFKWIENSGTYTTSQLANYILISLIQEIQEEMDDRIKSTLWLKDVGIVLRRLKVIPGNYPIEDVKDGYAERYLDIIFRVSRFLTVCNKEELVRFYNEWASYIDDSISDVPMAYNATQPTTVVESKDVLIDD